MPRYYHEENYHHRVRFVRRFRGLIILMVVLLVGGATYLTIDAYRQNKQSNQATAPTHETSFTYTPETELFTSQYFQFETGKNWSHVVNESKDNKFVYRYSRSGIVGQDLTIIVNNKESVPEVGRVLPVEVNSNGVLVPGRVSDYCRKYLPASVPTVTQMATVEGVAMLCDYDVTDYIAIVGIRGQGLPMKLQRADGAEATYTIIYRNVTATPNDEEIRRILNTFQAR